MHQLEAQMARKPCTLSQHDSGHIKELAAKLYKQLGLRLRVLTCISQDEHVGKNQFLQHSCS
jgi:hypothetical protein